MKKMLGLLAAMTLALTIAACGTDAGETATADSGDALGESVQVHGDWKIDVVDPDGTVADSIEFRNAFVGQSVLAQVLAQESAIQFWQIELTFDGAVCSGETTCASRAGTELDGDALVLTREIAVSGASVVEAVGGVLKVADPDTGETLDEPFSTKSLATADGGPGEVPVEAGQIVQVEVTYTFG